jgi:hypothetical protein
MKKIAMFVITIMIFASCQKDVKTLSIKVDLISSVNPTSPTLTCTLPGAPFAIANSGYFLRGTVTHLGRIDSVKSKGQDGFCNLSPALLLTTKTSGQIVAANGDKINYAGDDVIDLNNVVINGGTTASITGVWRITGGTGKFASAAGSININGTVNVAAEGGPTFSIKGEGIITY